VIKQVLFALGLLLTLSSSAQRDKTTFNRLLKESQTRDYTGPRPSLSEESKVKVSNLAPEHELDSIYKKDQYTSAKLHPADSNTIHIGLVLPFDETATAWKIYGYLNDKDPQKCDAYKLKEASKEALDFYQGLQYALSTRPSNQKLEFFLFDTHNNDSVVQDLLHNDTLGMCDIIIGPTTASQAKFIAGYCKRNKIVNIQPFVASKSFSMENPYLVRLMPTIDAHLQQIYEMVTDSFQDNNIILYTTKRERDLTAARTLDTLFKSYNQFNTHKLKYTFVNSGDSTLPVAKRSYTAHLSETQNNVLIMTCYDEALVNTTLRGIKEKENLTVFGMPTWIDADQIRPDYLNKAMPYFTEPFYADTAQTKVLDFIHDYAAANGQKPSPNCYMGYDAMNYLSLIFDKYGKAVIDGVNKESYEGMGYSFHISPSIKAARGSGEPVVNYYSNTAMHLFQVRDYRVWKIK
jgi:ABC-type branched-subunit amino acid transport system substrate-binding protein